MVCQKSTLKKYKDRPSPPYPAQDCKGMTKKGNDGRTYTSISDSRGIYKWIPKGLRMSTTKKKHPTKQGKQYEIHDNGGRPFLVDVGATSVTIWKQIYNMDTEEYETPIELMKLPYKRIWIGDDHLHFGYSEETPEKGNSILLETKKGVYVYIGQEIREFTPAEGDEIIDYNSYIGNNDVPYPFAIGKKYIYLFIEKVYVPKEGFDMSLDPYAQYYGIVKGMHATYPLRKMEKKLGGKVLQKRIW